MNIICGRNIENYWCELCSEYTICNRAHNWMIKHGYSIKHGRLASVGGKFNE